MKINSLKYNIVSIANWFGWLSIVDKNLVQDYLKSKKNEKQNSSRQLRLSFQLVSEIAVSICILFYIGSFTAAYLVYSSDVKKLVNEREKIILQLETTSADKIALGKIPLLQNTLIPKKPYFSKPTSIINSFRLGQVTHKPTVKILAKLIEKNKAILNALDLERVYLREANLEFANLANSKLNHANLKYVDLQDSILIGAELNEADLEKAKLMKADLLNAEMKNSILRKADLTNARINNADLEKANLQKAILKNATLIDTNLSFSYLDRANFEGANLTRAFFPKAEFRKANLQNAIFTDAILVGADLSQVKNLSHEQLCSANSLYGIKLEDKIEKQVRQRKPELFDRPDLSLQKKKLNKQKFATLLLILSEINNK